MKIFLGVVLLLLAFLCGGCTLTSLLSSGFSSDVLLLQLFVGGVPTALFGLPAWLLLRR